MKQNFKKDPEIFDSILDDLGNNYIEELFEFSHQHATSTLSVTSKTEQLVDKLKRPSFPPTQEFRNLKEYDEIDQQYAKQNKKYKYIFVGLDKKGTALWVKQQFEFYFCPVEKINKYRREHNQSPVWSEDWF